MQFAFTEDQELLRREARDVLANGGWGRDELNELGFLDRAVLFEEAGRANRGDEFFDAGAPEDEQLAALALEAAGIASRALELGVEHAKTREQFGRPIGGFQLTQAKLADMAVELHKGILLAHHLGRRMDAGRLRPEQVSFGKLNNVREAIEICRTARTILGANGISLEYPVIRHANNLESVLTYEGTSEMHTLALGQALTGHAAFR